jgi:glucose-6-phosphate 1-dehydrogenase
MPTLFYLFSRGFFECDFSIIIYGRRPMSREEFLSICEEAAKTGDPSGFNLSQWTAFAANLQLVTGDFADEKSYDSVFSLLGAASPLKKGCGRKIVFYLAVPPDAVPVITGQLSRFRGEMDLCDTKLIVEKPLGSDGRTAAEYQTAIETVFREDQIFRIDHYLGKETVQNIIFFRFSNTVFEPVWNNQYIDHVQITVAEELGIVNRSNYFDQAGIIRDFVQNHILQLISLVAMEPHAVSDKDAMRREKVKVYRAIRPFTEDRLRDDIVLGQYTSGKIGNSDVKCYCDEPGIPLASRTPTFFAGKFFLDNPRWSGVPFYVRVGKRLQRTVSKISVHFKKAPQEYFGSDCDTGRGNTLLFCIHPEQRISMEFGVKYPGSSNQAVPAYMNFDYGAIFGGVMLPPYARLLIDCLKGDLALFECREGIAAMWDVVDPLLDDAKGKKLLQLDSYPAGSWGPDRSLSLIRDDGREWYEED